MTRDDLTSEEEEIMHKLDVWALIKLRLSTNMLTEEELEEATNEGAHKLLQLSQLHQNQSKEITTTRLTPEEEEAMHEDALELLPHKKRKGNKNQAQEVKIAGKADKKRKIVEEGVSEETLRLLFQWSKIKPEKPPREMLVHDPEAVGVCSELMRKQLTESDLKGNQCRLMLGKTQVQKMMLHVMGKSERVETNNGLEVSVYGPDGEVHKMMFKMWSVDTPVLMSTGWKKFMADYELKAHCDFLTIWMFRHRETRQICFAINSTRFPVEKPLSRRILKDLF